LAGAPTATFKPEISAVDVETGTLDSERRLTIAEAEALAGFPIRKPAPLEGFAFSYATFHQPTQSVCLHFQITLQDFQEERNIAQGPASLAPQLAPQSSELNSVITETVQLGGADGRLGILGSGLVRQGEWACVGDDASSTGPAVSWQSEGYQFDVYALRGSFGVPFFTRLELLRLAETITGVSTHSPDEKDPEHLVTVADAEEMAGFDIKEPDKLPEGVVFNHAVYSIRDGAPTVDLYYFNASSGDYFSMLITQTPVSSTIGKVLEAQYRGLPLGAYELLTIGSMPAVYINGTWTEEHGVREWYSHPDIPRTLYWQTDGFLFMLSGGEFDNHDGKAKDRLAAVAESMR
jgi:hypothetical protein